MFVAGISDHLKRFTKGQDKPKEVDERSKKAAKYMFGSTFMACLTWYGYDTLKDQYMFPTSLGGSGDYALVYSKHPYPEHHPQLQNYYMAVTAYHLGSLLIHFFGERKADYVEMGLHHIVTMYLMIGSYMFNIWECGAVISFIHDATDLLGHITKFTGQLRMDKISVPLFLGVML